MPINSEVLDKNPFLRRIVGHTWWISFNLPQSTEQPCRGSRPQNSPELSARPATYHFNWHLLHMMLIHSPSGFNLIWNGEFCLSPIEIFNAAGNSFDARIPSLFCLALKNTKDPADQDLFLKVSSSSFFLTNSAITKPIDLYLFFQ